jgi:hypothetical protein
MVRKRGGEEAAYTRDAATQCLRRGLGVHHVFELPHFSWDWKKWAR